MISAFAHAAAANLAAVRGVAGEELRYVPDAEGAEPFDCAGPFTRGRPRTDDFGDLIELSSDEGEWILSAAELRLGMGSREPETGDLIEHGADRWKVEKRDGRTFSWSDPAGQTTMRVHVRRHRA